MMASLVPQLVAMGLPASLHEIACRKVMEQTFDAGNHFVFAEVDPDDDDEEDEEDAGEGVQRATRGRYTLHAAHAMPRHADVVLIDHMWTTTFPQARDHLRTLPGLAARVAAMLGVDVAADDTDHNTLWRAVWAHLCCYVLPLSDEYTRWFLHDEVGTAVGHSVTPNVKCCPLLVDPGVPGQPPFALSLLWPVRDLAEGERVTRDFLPHVPATDPTRPLRMLAFAAPSAASGGGGGGGDDAAVQAAINRLLQGASLLPPAPPPSSSSSSSSSSASATASPVTSPAEPLPQWRDALERLRRVREDRTATLQVCLPSRTLPRPPSSPYLAPI